MPVAVQLPGGRGQLVSADAKALKGEEYRKRAQEIDRRRPMFLCPCEPMGAGNASRTGTADRLVLVPFPERDFDITVVQGRVNILTASAGAVILMGLYIHEGNRAFHLVPGSRCTFTSGVAASTEVYNLSRPVTITKNMPLWVGIITSDAVVGISGTATTALVKLCAVANLTALPDRVRSGTPYATYPARFGYYVSAEAKELF